MWTVEIIQMLYNEWDGICIVKIPSVTSDRSYQVTFSMNYCKWNRIRFSKLKFEIVSSNNEMNSVATLSWSIKFA